MSGWTSLQADFTDALTDAEQAPPQGIINPAGDYSEKRFNVYRNNVTSSLIEALKDGFPMVARLLGEEYFKALAKSYLQDNLPTSPILILYGESFGDFMDHFPPLANYPYLGDVARLEYLQRLSTNAEDSAPIDQQALPEQDIWLHRPLPLMPATRWLVSDYPIYDLWRKHYHAPQLEITFTPQSVILLRPEYQVETLLLPQGGQIFLNALQENVTPFDALSHCLAQHPEADATTLLHLGLRGAKATSNS